MKDATMLHHEHQQWLNELSNINQELLTLIKFEKSAATNEIYKLQQKSKDLKSTINLHEKEIAWTLKASGINEDNELFEDHELIQKEMESLKLKINNLRKRVVNHHTKSQ